MYEKDGCLQTHTSSHSPHQIIPQLIKAHSRVLDIGCNTGSLAKTLKKKKIVCDGVDINNKALRIAAKYCRKVYLRDLYKSRLNLGSERYDYIVFADILEHLPQPNLILLNCKKNLKKDGKVIISLPNVARIEIRLKLLFGKFEYAPGILSPDHLRFFTKKSAKALIEESGFNTIKIIPTGLGYILKIFPNLLAFQFIYVCKQHVH